MPREYPRKLRVAAELQRAVNELLCTDTNDPRLAGVRVSAVEVSSDLSVARLYFSTLQPDEDVEPVERALAKAGGYLRRRLGRELRMRRVPELKFVKDTGPREGLRLSQLIDDANASSGGIADEPDDSTA
jgi:ribosome-binding factor A